MLTQADALWLNFSAAPSTSQSSFWAAYSAMAAYNAPYGQILANMQPFESLGVTSQVCENNATPCCSGVSYRYNSKCLPLAVIVTAD